MTHCFAVISDTHFFAPDRAPADKLYWNRVLQSRSADIAESLIDTIADMAPDFVVHCGDFTGMCDMENYDFGCQVMDTLSCPWYVAIGNHDTWYPGVRSAFSARYDLPEGQCFYRRDLAGLRFIFLDVAYWTSSEGQVSPYLDKDLYDSGNIRGMSPTEVELRWLEEELATSGDTPVILVSHAPLGFKDAYPLATLPRGRPVEAATTALVDVMGDVLLRDQMRSIVRRHPNVKAAFAGHWHISDVTRSEGVLYCQTASLREYPFEIRLVRVHDGQLDVTTHELKDPSFRHLSFVQEWGNSWVAGAPGDREFSLDLR
jgi:3',5'-cyclic AMP phosphodiesterase CpdA